MSNAFGSQPPRACVVGDGGWGTAMAMALLRAGTDVTLWGVDAEYLADMARTRENTRFLPGVPLPAALRFEPDLARALDGVDAAFVAVPTKHLRSALSRWPADFAGDRAPPVVSLAKGVECGTLARPTEIIAELTRAPRIAALCGPAHAEGVARAQPTMQVAASADADVARRVRTLVMSESMRIYPSDDVAGVELAAAVKNVIAVAAGICAGLDLGDNALAALVTRGVAEMTRLGVAAGARAETFRGLAGFGDAIVTCCSGHSRNRAVGFALGRGEKLADFLAARRTVAEGVTSAESCRALAQRLSVEMPITEQVWQVLFRDRNPAEAVKELMTRDARDGE